jgi:AraC-like DNA-binding protein
MVSLRCKTAVRQELKKLGLHFIIADMGVVDVMEDVTSEQIDKIRTGLSVTGLELIENKNALLIESIKNAIIEMLQISDESPKINFPKFLSTKLGHEYAYLANLFRSTGITLEKYIISYKIEQVKELIIYSEFNLTEIAWKLHYSSVAHLSNQFKKITGLTPSHFKMLKNHRLKIIEDK